MFSNELKYFLFALSDLLWLPKYFLRLCIICITKQYERPDWTCGKLRFFKADLEIIGECILETSLPSVLFLDWKVSS